MRGEERGANAEVAEKRGGTQREKGREELNAEGAERREAMGVQMRSRGLSRIDDVDRKVVVTRKFNKGFLKMGFDESETLGVGHWGEMCGGEYQFDHDTSGAIGFVNHVEIGLFILHQNNDLQERKRTNEIFPGFFERSPDVAMEIGREVATAKAGLWHQVDSVESRFDHVFS